MKHFTIDNSNNITLHASRKEARATGAAVFSTEEQFADAIGNDNPRLLEIWNSLPGVTPVKRFANRKTATEKIFRAIQNLGGTTATPESGGELEVAASEPIAQLEPAAAESIAPPAVDEPAVLAAEQQPAESLESAEAPVTIDMVTPAAEVQPAAELVASEETETTAAPVESAVEQTTPFDGDTIAPVGAWGADVAPETATPVRKAARKKRAPQTPTVETTSGAPREGSKTAQVIAMLKRDGGTTVAEIMAAMGWLQHTTRSMLSAGGSLTKKHGLVVTSEKVGDQRTYFIKG